MAVAYDNSGAANGSSISAAIGAGAKLLLVVAENDNGVTSSCTAGGVAMTLVSQANTGTGGIQMATYALANPPTGGSVAIAASGGGGFSSICWMSFTGGSTYASFTPVTSLSPGTHTATATGVGANDMMVGLFAVNDSPGAVGINNNNPTKGGNFETSAANTNTGTGSVSTTMSCSNTDNILQAFRVIASAPPVNDGFFLAAAGT